MKNVKKNRGGGDTDTPRAHRHKSACDGFGSRPIWARDSGIYLSIYVGICICMALAVDRYGCEIAVCIYICIYLYMYFLFRCSYLNYIYIYIHTYDTYIHRYIDTYIVDRYGRETAVYSPIFGASSLYARMCFIRT
jgi:hypothetical protein